MQETPPRTVAYTCLYARDARSPYVAMVILNVISLRRHNAALPCVVFDYSRNAEVAARLAAWQDALAFEVRPLQCDALLGRFEIRHAWGLRYDALLHVRDDDPAGSVFIHADADTLYLRDPADLAAGDFDYRLPANSGGEIKISDWLAVFNLRGEHTRRTLALARAFNQEPHVWAPLDSWSSRRQNYPTSESCMEVAIRLLGKQGFQPLDWAVAGQYQLHYAQWQRQNYASIHAVAETLLDGSGLRRRFETDFGALRSLIFRE